MGKKTGHANLPEANQFIDDELPARASDEDLKQARDFEGRQSHKESLDAVEVLQSLQVEVVVQSFRRKELKKCGLGLTTNLNLSLEVSKNGSTSFAQKSLGR